MAQRVTVEMTDDIDGTEAAETIAFRVDGTEYEIDLSKKNAAKRVIVKTCGSRSFRRLLAEPPRWAVQQVCPW